MMRKTENRREAERILETLDIAQQGSALDIKEELQLAAVHAMLDLADAIRARSWEMARDKG